MNLTGIIAISGKPGLYKVIAQGKNNIIVESLEERKRFPAYASDRISALEDISIYTYDEDKPLKEIFASIHEKENGGAAISHKEDAGKLATYLTEVLPNYDQERVYPSDIKKLFQWYNILHKAGELKVDEPEKAEAAAEPAEASGKEPKETKEKTAAAKKEKAPAAAKKTPAAKKAPAASAKASTKAASAKKVAAPKTGGGRGK